jgi:NADP-dependent 3-hydroxy acid dehydrogenase YdfG
VHSPRPLLCSWCSTAASEVDILVNDAGVYEFTSTPDTTAHSVDRHLAINTRAPFKLVAALAPGMAKRGHGAIVNISSTAATSVASVGAAYAMDQVTARGRIGVTRRRSRRSCCSWSRSAAAT